MLQKQHYIFDSKVKDQHGIMTAILHHSASQLRAYNGVLKPSFRSLFLPGRLERRQLSLVLQRERD